MPDHHPHKPPSALISTTWFRSGETTGEGRSILVEHHQHRPIPPSSTKQRRSDSNAKTIDGSRSTQSNYKHGGGELAKPDWQGNKWKEPSPTTLQASPVSDVWSLLEGMRMSLGSGRVRWSSADKVSYQYIYFYSKICIQYTCRCAAATSEWMWSRQLAGAHATSESITLAICRRRATVSILLYLFASSYLILVQINLCGISPQSTHHAAVIRGWFQARHHIASSQAWFI